MKNKLNPLRKELKKKNEAKDNEYKLYIALIKFRKKYSL